MRIIGCLILVALASAETQTPVTGRWRAVLLTPDGGTQNISLELDARGETVIGNLDGTSAGELMWHPLPQASASPLSLANPEIK